MAVLKIVPKLYQEKISEKLKEEILKTANQEEILTVVDLSEDVKGWKKNLQKMLDELNTRKGITGTFPYILAQKQWTKCLIE